MSTTVDELRPKGPKYHFELKQRIEEVIEEINSKVSLVVVEGIHDERVLRGMALKAPIERFCDSHVPRFEFVERIAKNYKGLTVLVLFDYDREGIIMSKRLSVELEEFGVRVERKIRDELGEILVREGIRRIEEIEPVLSKAEW